MEEQTLNTRVADIIKHLNLSASAFARSLGTSATRISNITQGRNKPDSRLLSSIVETYPVINALWLLTGQGNMLYNVNNSGLMDSELLTDMGAKKGEDANNNSPSDSPSDSPDGEKLRKTGESRTESKNSLVDDMKHEFDYLFAQKGQSSRLLTPEQIEAGELWREIKDRHHGDDEAAISEMVHIRNRPEYARTARKLHELREKLKFDLQKNDPELLQITQEAELTSHLISDLRMVQMRYFGIFAEAQQNFALAGRPLTKSSIEDITYSEYREAMLKVANTLRPFAELIRTYNTKIQEILGESGPADSDNLIHQYLL